MPRDTSLVLEVIHDQHWTPDFGFAGEFLMYRYIIVGRGLIGSAAARHLSAWQG